MHEEAKALEFCSNCEFPLNSFVKTMQSLFFFLMFTAFDVFVVVPISWELETVIWRS